MKLKQIAAVVKKQKHIGIFNLDGVQWVSTGSAAYPLYSLPVLNSDSLLAVLDIPEEKDNGFFLRFIDVPGGLNFGDYDECENLITRDNIYIQYNGMCLEPLPTSSGVVFVNTRYLKPFCGEDNIDFYERTTVSGKPYIVAKVGFTIVGVIMPENVINQKFVKKLNTVCECVNLSFENSGGEKND